MESDVTSVQTGGTAGDKSQLSVPDQDAGVLVPRTSSVEPTVSVVMPTLNEAAGVRECIERVKTGLRRAGVNGEVILSDSSTDRTPEIGREMGAHVIHPDREGYGYAYRYAFEHVRGEYVVMGDADTTYDFEELPKLLEPVAGGDADICMGTRLEGEIKDGAMPPLHRYVGNPLLTRFLNVFYDAGVTDAHSGFRVFHRDLIDALDLYADGMEFASEMVMEAAARDIHIEEVPITYHERTGEATLDSFQDGWRHLKFMLVNAPGYLFSVPGAAALAVGVTLMAFSFFGISVGGVGFGPHSMIAGSLLVIVGYQVSNLGVFATVAGDPIRKPSDPITTWITERIQMEHAASFGLGMFTVGGVYAAYLVLEWVESGFVRLPLLNADIVAFTAIVLGVQTIFSAFFLSTVAGDTR